MQRNEVDYGRYGPIKNGKLETKTSLRLKATSKVTGIACVALVIVIILGLFTPLLPLSAAALAILGFTAFFTGTFSLTTWFLAGTFKSPPKLYDREDRIVSRKPAIPSPQPPTPGSSPYRDPQLRSGPAAVGVDPKPSIARSNPVSMPARVVNWVRGLFGHRDVPEQVTQLSDEAEKLPQKAL